MFGAVAGTSQQTDYERLSVCVEVSEWSYQMSLIYFNEFTKKQHEIENTVFLLIEPRALFFNFSVEESSIGRGLNWRKSGIRNKP